MSAFKRSYLLTITSVIRTPPDPNRPYKLSVEEGFEGVPRSVEEFKVTELRVSAKIIETVSSSNNKNIEIRIFNAPEDVISKLKKPNAYITLSAGYSLETNSGKTTIPEDLPVIFVGEVINMSTSKTRSDFITTISAKESEVTGRDTYMTQVYAGGQTITFIMEDIVNNHMPKVSIGRIELGPISVPKQRLNNPYLAYGKVTDVIEELKKDFGFITYTLGNKFYAQSENFGRAKRVVTIRPSDVIGDLLPSSGTNNVSNPSKVKAGFKIRVFLDGRVSTKDSIQIEDFAEDKNGEYKIIDLAHVMDTRGQDWYTQLTVEGV